MLALLKVTGDWQKFKGLEGAEGTLRTKAPRVDKRAVFEAAAKAAMNEPKDGATTPRKKAPKLVEDAADEGAPGGSETSVQTESAGETSQAEG